MCKEINPLVVIPNSAGNEAEVHFLDLAAKLGQLLIEPLIKRLI